MRKTIPILFIGLLCLPAIAPADDTIPLTIQVLPSKKLSLAGWHKPIRKGITDSLIKAGWEVVGSDGLATAGDILEEAGIEIEDDMTQIAMAMGSDLTVVFDGSFTKGDKATSVLLLSVRAIKPGTGRLLVSKTVQATGEGKEPKLSAIQNALAQIMPKINQLLSRNVSQRPVNGTHRLVILVNPPKDTDFSMRQVLLKACNFSEATLSTKAVVEFHTHCSLDRAALLAKIESGIKMKLDDAPHKVLKSKHDSIVIRFD